MDSFCVPGYDVGQLVGFGGSGEVWQARELATGHVVALKRLRTNGTSAVTGEPPSARQLHREAALLATVRHEHVVALRAVVPTDDGLVLVLDFAAGGSLASVLGVRGRLSPGEVVTIGAPLAQALSDIHARGLVHGDVTPANVLFDVSGKPLLADLGVARLAGEKPAITGMTPGFAAPEVIAGGAATPASDVYGLAAVCYAALAGGDAPAGLSCALEDALDPDPRVRPDAATFARALYASCAPEAVRLVKHSGVRTTTPPTHHAVRSGASVPAGASALLAAPPGGRHRPRGRRPLLVRRAFLGLAAAGLLAAAAAVGVGWASHQRSAAASAEPVASSSVPSSSVPSSAGGEVAASAAGDPQWVRVMAALDKTRDQAFLDADPAELDGVYVANSPALAADEQTLAELASAGERARGLALRLTAVVVKSQTGTDVELEVRDVLPGYDLARSDGTVVHQAGRAERTWVVTLRATAPDAPWRIDTIASG